MSFVEFRWLKETSIRAVTNGRRGQVFHFSWRHTVTSGDEDPTPQSRAASSPLSTALCHAYA